MTKRFSLTTLCLAAALTLLAAGGNASAQPKTIRPNASIELPSPSEPSAMYGQCWRRLGPFPTQYRAYQVRAYVQSRGYTVGPVYGQGGVVTRYGRRYYFRVYYRC
jgi:hypothetical protein